MNSIKILLILLAFNFNGQVFAAIPSEEREALIELYQNTQGSEWLKNEGWLGPSGTECQWFGISCEQNHVTGINLAANQLTGPLPPSLSKLSYLKELSFSLNQLSGSIPPELGDLSYLNTLHLYNNHLTGGIPPTLMNLKDLQSLTLSQNHLSGVIPPSISQLTQLKVLGLSYNLLSGSIPVSIGQLQNLVRLDLNNNYLSNAIPESLAQLTSLEYLTLDNNELTGSIPSILAQLINLQYLHLDHNLLTGSIPAAIATLPKLTSLSLRNNRLDGTIPTQLTNLNQLTYITLSHNCLVTANASLINFVDAINAKALYPDQEWLTRQNTDCSELTLENAVYDENTYMLTIQDIQRANQHFQIKLKLINNNEFNLIYAKLINDSSQHQPADYDPITLDMFVPKLTAFGHNYQVLFKHLYNYQFRIETVEYIGE